MLIEEKALRNWIDNFYGYGSWQARIWFVAYEESGGEVPEEVAEKLNYFQKTHAAQEGTLCDIRELYKQVAIRWEGPKANLFTNRYEYRFDNNAVLNGVWKNLIAFIHGYRNENLPDPLAYQKHKFASPTAQREALIQLYPLPSPHGHSWYYSWLDVPNMAFLKSRTLYEEHVFQHRIGRIISNIAAYKPELVLMYGMNNINSLKGSLQTLSPDLKFKMIKATKRQIPQHHRANLRHASVGEANLNGTTLLITTQIPALRHGRIETGFDWEEFGRTVKSN